MGSLFKKRPSTQDLIEDVRNNKNIPEKEKGPLKERLKQLKEEKDSLKKRLKQGKDKDSLNKRLEQLKKEKDELAEQIKNWTRGGKEKSDEEELQTLRSKLDKQEVELKWRKTHRYADVIFLDADTAHPNLSIVENKSLTHEAQPQKIKSAPERFDSTVCVLGSEGFSSGKHYWEVDVRKCSDWDLGVVKKSIQKQGKLSLSPKEGFWALGFSGRDYWAKTDPWTQVKVQKKPQKIGVYLNYEDKGEVTFFNVTDCSELFTFNDCSFSGEVCPFFKNSHKGATLRICSMREED